MKLYQQLEQTFKMRINSNSEIIPYIKNLSEMGKFDEPKKIAAIAILLDRLGKLEDEADTEKSFAEITSQNVPSTGGIAANTSSQSETAQSATYSSTSNKSIPLDPIPEDGTNTDVTGEAPDNTVSEFTPENITDPAKPDSTTSS